MNVIYRRYILFPFRQPILNFHRRYNLVLTVREHLLEYCKYIMYLTNPKYIKLILFFRLSIKIKLFSTNVPFYKRVIYDSETCRGGMARACNYKSTSCGFDFSLALIMN